MPGDIIELPIGIRKTHELLAKKMAGKYGLIKLLFSAGPRHTGALD
jgi:hypothetical protein